MSARLRGIAKETERIVAEGRYRAPRGHQVSLDGPIARAAGAT